MNRYRTVALLITSIFLSSLTAVAWGQGGEEPPPLEIDPENAIVWHGEETEDWDNPFTDPGAVVYHDGQFHMFRNGFRGWPDTVDIGYLTSADGLTWAEVSEVPIINSDAHPFDVTAVLASSALVEPDGTWVLYFYTWPRIGGSDPGAVARATAPEPTGPWTFDAELLLLPGGEGAWDANQITAPSVVKTEDDTYLMYYSGQMGDQSDIQWAIGLATSPDGITWTKYDDPETTAPPFAESDPVFTPAADPEAWDGDQVHQPRVTLTPDGFVLLYRAYTGAGQSPGLGLALSQDGTAFERIAAAPVFSDKEIRRRGVWFTELAYHDGTYYLFVELQRNYQNQTDIYVGTISGPIS